MNANDKEKKYELVRSYLSEISSSKQTGELYLFVVGINSYKKETNLRYCKNEASTFIDIFWRNHEIKEKNIYSFFDDRATKSNIISCLENFQKMLNPQDRLIIYFAGHGHNTEHLNLFVPHDGSKDNPSSCIENRYIAKSIMDLELESTLLFYDIKFSALEFEDYRFKTETDYLKTLRNQIKHFKTEHLYKEFVRFFSRNNPLRVKEAFCFFQEKNRLKSNQHLSWHYDDKLNVFLKEKYSDLLELIKEHKTEQALQKLILILENNDSDLYGRVETLLYKLNETKRSSKKIEKDKKKDAATIDQIACEVIERVNQNGFYLVKTPKPRKSKPTKNKEKIKILFTSANPRDGNYLRLNKEAKEIEYELMKARFRDKFEFIKLKTLNISELQDALLNETPQFLHFSGHGNCEGIFLLNEIDQKALVKTKPLADLFKLFANEIQCIFLNSCHSINQSEEISKYVKKVVCMNNRVPDEAAIRFAADFYKSIGAGKDIDFSFNFAKNSISLYGIAGIDVPTLLPKN